MWSRETCTAVLNALQDTPVIRQAQTGLYRPASEEEATTIGKTVERVVELAGHQEIKTLKVQPGDTLVFTTNQRLNETDYMRFRLLLGKSHPEQKVMLLENVALSSVLRPDAHTAPDIEPSYDTADGWEWRSGIRVLPPGVAPEDPERIRMPDWDGWVDPARARTLAADLLSAAVRAEREA